MHFFFCPDMQSGLVSLSEEESRHAVQVLRLGVGQRIGLLDGRGTKAMAELVDAGSRRCVAMVLDSAKAPAERAARIHLAVGRIKQADRMEWLVEKAVEIGVDRITPLATARTEKGRTRIDRLERVAISALKQCQRAWLPEIDELTPLADLLQGPLPPQRFFGLMGGESLPFTDLYAPDRDALVIIGPEGDFTPGEAERMREAGAMPVSLGSARLRTETAALAACAWMGLLQAGTFAP